MGLRLRVSDHSSPWRYNRYCLPACTNLGQNPTGTKISELNTIQGGVASPYLSSSLPFCLRFNIELRRGCLISTLQNSIQGLGLRVTLAGTAPARSQIISSPHVHGLVRPSAWSHHRQAFRLQAQRCRCIRLSPLTHDMSSTIEAKRRS